MAACCRYWFAVKESGQHAPRRFAIRVDILDLHNTGRPNLISVSIDRRDKPRLIVASVEGPMGIKYTAGIAKCSLGGVSCSSWRERVMKCSVVGEAYFLFVYGLGYIRNICLSFTRISRYC